MKSQGAAASGRKSIHPAARVGLVALTVRDLKSQIGFYTQTLGFRLHWEKASAAGLGAGGGDFLRLYESPGARRFNHVTGLYHFAVLFPDKRGLAAAVRRLFALHYPNYPTDHIMTKTAYLADPEGQEIELYADTPEDGSFYFKEGRFFAVRADGTASDGREPLDVEALFRELPPEGAADGPVPAGTRLGHVHLYVRDVAEALRFYRDALGFEEAGHAPDLRMAFAAAGGYHHHIGLNSWMGEGAPPPPPGALGLRFFTVVLPDAEELESVLDRAKSAGAKIEFVEEGALLYDPSRNGIVLAAAEAEGSS